MAKAKTAASVTLHKVESGKRLKWAIARTGTSVTVKFGEASGKQKEKAHRLATPAKAKAHYEQLVATQRADGYRRVGEIDAEVLPLPRDEALEAAIRENRDDPGPYLVYADWLQSHDSKHGELIVLAHGNKRKQANAIGKRIGLPSKDFATFGWRHGFWQWLRIENQLDWMDSSFEAVAFATQLFASPLCAVLEELRIGIVRWDFEDQPDIIAAAGKHAWAKDLVRLHVGDVADNIDMDHHTIGDVGKVITKSFPRLRSLKLHSGAATWSGPNNFGIGGLDLPLLEELVIETCAMDTKRMKAVVAAKLPALQRLELWFGATDRDGTAKTADVMPIFEGVFPNVRHLGLRNSELCTDFVRLVPASKLAKQLESLDLSMGTLSDSDAGELADARAKLPKLKSLNVGRSYLTKVGLTRLKTAFKGVEIASKNMKEPYDWDPDGRYVSVHE